MPRSGPGKCSLPGICRPAHKTRGTPPGAPGLPGPRVRLSGPHGKNYSGRSGHEPFHHGGAGACLFRHRLEPWPAGCGGHAGPGSGFLEQISLRGNGECLTPYPSSCSRAVPYHVPENFSGAPGLTKQFPETASGRLAGSYLHGSFSPITPCFKCLF